MSKNLSVHTSPESIFLLPNVFPAFFSKANLFTEDKLANQNQAQYLTSEALSSAREKKKKDRVCLSTYWWGREETDVSIMWMVPRLRMHTPGECSGCLWNICVVVEAYISWSWVHFQKHWALLGNRIMPCPPPHTPLFPRHHCWYQWTWEHCQPSQVVDTSEVSQWKPQVAILRETREDRGHTQESFVCFLKQDLAM